MLRTSRNQLKCNNPRYERTSSRARGGISLVEMLVVVILIGLATAIGLPKFVAIRARTQLDDAAQQLAGDIRRAQAEAQRLNKSIRVYKTGSAAYTIDEVGDRQLLIDATSSWTSDTLKVAALGPPVTSGSVVIVYGAYSRTVVLAKNGLLTVQ